MVELTTMNNNWETTISELLAIYRGALIAIIPWLEKAKINWKEGESYDDWDKIAGTLYENIVYSSITGEISQNESIASYDFHYNDYSAIDSIQVISNEYSNSKFAFVSFQSIAFPMDTIEVAALNSSYKVIEYLTMKVEGSEFVLVKNSNGKKEIIDKINIIL